MDHKVVLPGDEPGDDPNRVMKTAEVARLIGLSPSTIVAKGHVDHRAYDASFPLPLRLARNSIGFRRLEILFWLQQREDAAKAKVEKASAAKSAA